jgi:hypothetical protein
MAGLFERLFKREEEKSEPIALIFTEIPGWLDEDKINQRSDLEDMTQDSQRIIRDAIVDLHSRVQQLKKVQIDESTPIRLQKVVKTAIPAFIATMDITLSRHFSKEPEEFYEESVDLLKGSMKVMKGQGKYIGAVFPEEMKEIRSCISTIGNELNEMAGEITKSRETAIKIQEVRNAYVMITKNIEEFQEKNRQWKTLWKNIEKDEERISTLSKEVLALESDDEVKVWRESQKKIEDLEIDREILVKEYSHLASTLANVLRKAEYIAGKQDPDLAKSIAVLKNECEQRNPDKIDNIIDLITSVIPSISDMVEKNELKIKNKTERELFSIEGELIEKLRILGSRYHALDESIQNIRMEITGQDKINKINEFKLKIKKIKLKHEDDLNKMTNTETSLASHKNEFPGLIEELKEKISALKGSDVVLNMDGAGIPV